MQSWLGQRSASLVRVGKPWPADGRVSVHAWGGAAGSRPVPGTLKRYEGGFSLVELMITLVVAVVLVMIAVPSFRNITLSNKLTTTANDIVGAINSARMEAVKRNAGTLFCSNSSSVNSSDPLGGECGTKAGAVVALKGGVPTQVLAGTSGITAPLRLNGDMTALRFTAQGLGQKVGTSIPYNAIVADICTSQMSAGNHRVITMTAGSILVTTTTSKGCPQS